jgi:hypothetical protein
MLPGEIDLPKAISTRGASGKKERKKVKTHKTPSLKMLRATLSETCRLKILISFHVLLLQHPFEFVIGSLSNFDFTKDYKISQSFS